MESSAVISACGLYRYKLDRLWSGDHALPFIMLNPSTADDTVNDPTIRRCMGFARREGHGGIIVVNLYGLRATDPKELKRSGNPIGPANDHYLLEVGDWARRAGVPLICAWGAGAAQARVDRIVSQLEYAGVTLSCLGKTKGGHPRHPLYVKGDQPLEFFP